MARSQKETDALTFRPLQGVIGPTGPAPLVPSGTLPHRVKNDIIVQWASGTAWVGGTGVATGQGHQLGPSGAMADGSFHQIRIKASSARDVWVHATQGVVRWFVH